MAKPENRAGILHDVYVSTSAIHGKGVFATNPIKKNTELGFLEGVPTKRNGLHVLWIDDSSGWRVTNDFRYLNHSKKPNIEVDVGGEKPRAYAIRSIKADEELTFDYGWD